MAASASRYARWRADLSRYDQEAAWSQAREKEARRRYSALKDDLTRAPDGSYPTEMHDDGTRAGTSSKHTPTPPLEVNNPLSLSDKNPWHTYFASLSMLDQIKVDVQRAFPEDEVLRSEVAQQQLIRVLFVWSLMKDNENVGYRQGMHEIAAISWLVRKDAQQTSSKEDRWVEEDTFTLFELIMARAKPWYEWKSQPKVSSCNHLPIEQTS
jgi:TBC1 domain family protein 5